MDRADVEAVAQERAAGLLMAGQPVTVSLEPLALLREDTIAVVRASAPTCADCATILKNIVDGNRLRPAWRPDGSPFPYEEMKRHILEAIGVALSPAMRDFVKRRAGTCRKPDGVGCFYCARILDSLSKDGMLREWPQDKTPEQGKIPVESQKAHLMLETGRAVEWEEVH